MPYAPHPSFTPPELESITIWRYLDFAKFMWTIEHKALYFCRVDWLPDPLEGRLPPFLRSRWTNPEVPPESKRIAKQFHAVMEYQARAHFVSCWSMNEHDTPAMWQYGKGEYGVALRSSYSRLRDSLERESRSVFIGTISYGDGATGRRQIGPPDFVVRKEKWWDYERELRAAVRLPGERGSSDQDLSEGLGISVDLDVLVESVFVAPTAPPWFAEVVEAVMRRYGLPQPVVPSVLLREPSSLFDTAEQREPTVSRLSVVDAQAPHMPIGRRQCRTPKGNTAKRFSLLERV